MYSHSIEYSKFNGWFTVVFVANNTLAVLSLPSPFGQSSMILSISHYSLGMFAFIWTLSPLGNIYCGSTRGNFRFICDLSH